MGAMIQVGILGFGFMGRTHFQRYSQLENVRVSALADREMERQQADFLPDGNLDLGLGTLDLSGTTIFSSAEELIRDKRVDVVDVCLPTFLHSRYVIEALQNGKHVICEKPLALNSTEAFKMIGTAEGNRRSLFVAQVIRFWPEYRYLYDLVHQGEYGKLLYLNMYRRTAEAAWTWEDWNKDPKKSGGIIDIRIHELDFIHFMLGMPTRLYAQALGSRNIIRSQYSYTSGAIVSIEHNRILPPSINFEDGFDAVFEGALLRYCGQKNPKLCLYPKSSFNEPIYPQLSGDAYLEELRYFTNCIEKNEPCNELASPEGAARALELWENELQSVEEGGVIVLK
jgi:predicted dehydrogenase